MNCGPQASNGTPSGSVLAVLKASAATRQGDYAAAQAALQTAVRQRPQETALRELTHQVTMLATHPVKGRPPEPAPLQPGDTLDGWLLEARLGAGGWGQVFKATARARPGPSRSCTPNSPPIALSWSASRRDRLPARLPRHPNLVGIEADGLRLLPDQQTWYLAMEYIDGPTLEQLSRRQDPLTEEPGPQGLSRRHRRPGPGPRGRHRPPRHQAGQPDLPQERSASGVRGFRPGRGRRGDFGQTQGGRHLHPVRRPGAALRRPGHPGQRRVQPLCRDPLRPELRQAGPAQAEPLFPRA